MFPARYFPDRYFAARYFPKVGADAPEATAGYATTTILSDAAALTIADDTATLSITRN